MISLLNKYIYLWFCTYNLCIKRQRTERTSEQCYMVSSGKRKCGWLFPLFLPIFPPFSAMKVHPDTSSKTKTKQAKIVTHAHCLSRHDSAAMGWLQLSNWPSRRFSWADTVTQMKWLSSSQERVGEFGLPHTKRNTFEKQKRADDLGSFNFFK